MKYIKKFENIEELWESSIPSNKEIKDIDKIITEFKYILEDEGCILEYGDDLAWKIGLGHLTNIENYKFIPNLRKTPEFEEFIDRITEELDKIGMKILKIEQAQYGKMDFDLQMIICKNIKGWNGLILADLTNLDHL